MDMKTKPYELVRFDDLPGVPCPCGTARRAFADTEDFPGTIHVTEISADARLHYHQRLTETYGSIPFFGKVISRKSLTLLRFETRLRF